MRRLPALLLILACVALCALFMARAFAEVRAETLRDLDNQQSLLARQAARGIEDFFVRCQRMLAALANNPQVAAMESPKAIERLQILREAGAPDLMSLTRVDAAGIIRLSTPYAAAVGADISSQEHVRLLLREQRPVVSEVFTAAQGFPAVAVHAPSFDAGRFVGSMAALLPFEVVSQRYVHDLRATPGGGALVVSRAGLVLSSPFPGQAGRSIRDLYPEPEAARLLIEPLLRGEAGCASFTCPLQSGGPQPGQRLRGAFVPARLENTFWSILVLCPEKEALAGVEGFRSAWLGAALFLALAVALGAWALARRPPGAPPGPSLHEE
jgi:two-component system, cell cycle sensor histidine kinase and response regulator CckA